MATGKLTPRQKMINMMYLVLIAMLALNVSREILASFHLFELSFLNGNQSSDKRNSELMSRFEANLQNDMMKARTEEWYKLAEETRKTSTEFCQFIEKMKNELIEQGGGRKENTSNSKLPTELKRPDDVETHTHYFMKQGGNNGEILQKRINKTAELLVSKILKARNGEKLSQLMLHNTGLKAINPERNEEGKQLTWSETYLENAPLASVITTLTKIQSDCKSLETEVLNVLNENISINTLINDSQIAMIIPESQSVLSGENFKARVALVTYDSKAGSKILVNGQEVEVVNGVGQLSIPASGTGQHQLVASIESIDPATGQPKMVNSAPFVWNSYTASAAVSADNMNVLFKGLENPLSISVPGVTPANIIVTANNGVTLKSTGNGKYIATVKGSAKSANVTVMAKMADGNIRNMGVMPFQLREVPKPKLMFGSLEPGTYSATQVKSQKQLYAYLEDFYFKNVKFTITNYKISIFNQRSPGLYSGGERGSSLQRSAARLNTLKSGDIIYLDELEASGPNGKIRLMPVTIKIK